MKYYFILILLSLQIIVFGRQTKDSCKIISINIGKDGIVHWITRSDPNHTPFTVEQYRWNKWVKIGQVDVPTPFSETQTYYFKSIPYSGENQIRVFHRNDTTLFRAVKWESDTPVVKFSINKDTKEIQFTNETLFEIWDTKGNVIKRGLTQTIWYKDIPSGSYILNYDNSTEELKL
jgi:hypothetical protein